MTKDEWIWVAIRIFGIYLLVLAVISIPDAIGYVYTMIQVAEVAVLEHDVSTKLAVSMRDAAMFKGVIALSQFFIFSVFAYYLLKHGKLLHKLASSEKA